MARIAKSLEVLRQQVNRAFPSRSKASDGWLGDAKHRARKSDHNPNRHGHVQALDITHDPKVGLDAGEMANALRLSQDPRIKYIISNARIAGGAHFNWRPYSGANAHRQHFHVSVKDDQRLYDNTNNWQLEPVYSFANSYLSDDVEGEPIDEYGIMEETPEGRPSMLARHKGKLLGGSGSGLGLGYASYIEPMTLYVVGGVALLLILAAVGFFIWLKPDRNKIKKWIWRKLG